MRSTTAVMVVATAAIGCLIGARATAAANDDEEDLIRRAIELRKHGNDRAAFEELQRAYGIARSPRAAAQLGFAEQALGLWPQAEAHVREALGYGDDPWIRKHRPTVEDALATIRAHVARVQIVGGQPGAQVTVNGQAAGSMPLAEAVSVSAGPVDIEVRAAGYAPALKTVNVAAGELARVPFTLQPTAPAQSSRPAPFRPRAATPVAVNPLAAPEPAPMLARTSDPGRAKRATGIALVAGGVLAIGGGVAASVVAKDKFDAIRTDAAADRPYNASNGNWKSYETGAAVLYALGGAAVVGGVVLYVVGRPSTETGRAPAVSSIAVRPTVTPGRAGATLAVRF